MDTPWIQHDNWPGFDPAQRIRLLKEHGLEVEERNGWLRLYLHRGRQRGMALMTALTGAAFLAVPFVLPEHQAYPTGVVGLVFAVFGASLLLLGLYLPFNALDVRISRHEIRRVRRWLGLAIRARRISPAEIESLEIERGPAISALDATALRYALVGRGGFGRLTLIENIPDRGLVEAVHRQVVVAAGLRPAPTH